MIESKFRDPNFLEPIGIKFESNQYISPDWRELELEPMNYLCGFLDELSRGPSQGILTHYSVDYYL